MNNNIDKLFYYVSFLLIFLVGCENEVRQDESEKEFVLKNNIHNIKCIEVKITILSYCGKRCMMKKVI